MKRIESLDFLRGLMAFGMMVYHYSMESFGVIDAEFFIGKIGVYAVSVFYILSGLSLTVVYKNSMDQRQGVLSFAIKRIFRIFPLFWAATFLSLALAAAKHFNAGIAYPFDSTLIALNLTLLFGFIRPEAYIATGAWSIGNEMVFYAAFPILVYFGKKQKSLLLVTGALSFAVYWYFAFGVMEGTRSIEEQWTSYVHPLNQIFLFVSGVIIGFFVRQNKSTTIGHYVVLVLLVAFFSLFPVAGDKISLVTGITRLLMSVCCVAFVAVLYHSGISFDNWFGRSLSFLGEVSYSLYLIHPIVAIPLMVFAKSLNVPVAPTLFIGGIPLTLLISSLSYRFLEKPLMKRGSEFAKHVTIAS